ncbi:MAG TPA: ATP-binding protein [Kofleriaceae bacterium]|nr:ATP-binding protein [Kofleriaceae bacterium]
MNEVTTQTVALLVDALELRGLRPQALWADLGLTAAQLQPGERIGWTTWIELIARVERACGAEQLERLFVPGAGARTGHSFVRLANSFLSLRDLFSLFARWGLRRNVMTLSARFEPRTDLDARFTVAVDPTCPGSLPTLRFLSGVLHSLPTLQDLPPAQVRLEPGATPHHAVYQLQLPRDRSRLGRARRLLRLAGGASAALDELEQQATEIAAKNLALEQQLAETARAGAALAERDEWLRLALDAARLGIWRWTPSERRVRLSDDLAKLIGVAGQVDLATRAVTERIHPEDRDRLTATITDALADQRPFAVECRMVRASGELGWIVIKGRAVHGSDPSRIHLVGTVADITEQKLLDSQLRFADRLIAAGTLAAGVAHEINNPLGYVAGHLELLRRGLAVATPDPAVTDALAQMSEGLERIRDVVSDLRAFARPEEDVVTRLVPRTVCEAALRIGSSMVRHRATLTTDFAADTPAVMGNPSRLGQVVINLIVNAGQAMPADRAAADNHVGVRTFRLPTGEAAIEVRDNGVGIAPDAVPRLFDPFFTTKEAGVGTGLGLAVCQRIVGSLDGRIDVDSTPGVGSTFTIVLPPAPAPAPSPVAPAPAPAPAPAAAATGRRVLVIDDEPVLRRLLRAMLESEGHTVADADGGRAGLAVALDGGPFDAILCDLMMPDLDGVAVHEALAERRPELVRRLVFISGGAVSDRARAFAERPDIVLLAKPFTMDQLLSALVTVGGAT